MRILRSPVTGLFLLAPLVAEFFLGDFPVYLLPLILPLSLWYGAGAVLIREVTRRAGRGWPTMLLLALAFGVVEEGLLTMSLFNPDYADQRLLDHGYVAALGIGLPWTVLVLTLHVLWSVAAPVVLIEEAQGDPRTTPWLTDRGLVGIGGCLALGAVVTFSTNYPAYGHFVASVPQLASSAVVAAVLVMAAFRLPRRSTTPRPASYAAPTARVVLAVTMVCAGVFQVGGHAERVAVAVPVMLASLAGLAVTVARWSAGAGWGPSHRLTIGAGLVLTYTWRAFFAGYGDSPAETVVAVISYVTYAAAALAILRICARRVVRSDEATEQPGPPTDPGSDRGRHGGVAVRPSLKR